jgi:hypothetical protein
MKYEDVELEVTIDKDGEVQILVKGVEGKRCLLVTKELERLLGGEVDRQMHSVRIGQSVTDKNRDVAT